jgi:uncharacterized short protein YbdD (DUF466 family)
VGGSPLYSVYSGRIFTHLKIHHPNIQPVQQKLHFHHDQKSYKYPSFPLRFQFSSLALSTQPRFVTSKMRTKHDPTLKYMANVVDFGEHSNNGIQRAVLPCTESGYSDTLLIFDE